MPRTDTPTVLWTLRNGAKQLTCSVQLLPHGLELHLALNGDRPYCSRTFPTQDLACVGDQQGWLFS